MLRKALLVIGALTLGAALYCAIIGFYPILPHLLVFGLMLTAGIVWERWRYKNAVTEAPAQPGWQATGERSSWTRSSGKLVEVYFDPGGSGARHYVDAEPGPGARP